MVRPSSGPASSGVRMSRPRSAAPVSTSSNTASRSSAVRICHYPRDWSFQVPLGIRAAGHEPRSRRGAVVRLTGVIVPMTPLARHLPPGALGRVRALFLALAVLSGLLTAITACTPHAPAAQRVTVVALVLGLCAHWTAGYRRGRFPLAGEVLEAAALYVVLRFTPGSPLLPLLGLMFRSLYGGPRAAA